METIENNRHSLFAFLSLLLICSGAIIDELSTRIALMWFPVLIYETNNFTIYLMGRNLWLAVDILVVFILWIFSLTAYLWVSDNLNSEKYGWIVGGAGPLLFGTVRWMAGIHNIQLILGCLK